MTDRYERVRSALEGLRERCAQEGERITRRRRAGAAMINNEAVKPCEVAVAIRKIDVQQYYECAVREIEALRADIAESDEIREKLGHLLTRTAAALKGEPPAGVWHSWHDLPEKATQLAERVQRDEALLRQALEALKKVAQALDWYAHGCCRGFDDGPLLTTSEAVELAKRTIAAAEVCHDARR